MNSDRHVFSWSLPLGIWFGARVRLSIFFLLIAPIICHRLGDLRVGLVTSGLLLLSVLLHEFGHVLAARMTGGDGDEIVAAPFGGLVPCRPDQLLNSQLWTLAGGPLVNFGLCLLSLAGGLHQTGYLASALSPFEFPELSLTGGFSEAVTPLLVLLFKVNWLLLVINVLPALPLDGGRLLQQVLSQRFDEVVARGIVSSIGMLTGALLLLGGMFAGNAWVVALGAVLMLFNPQESLPPNELEDSEEDSFLGYDFSEGYTSFERSAPLQNEDDEPGVIGRWKNQREEDRRRRQEEEDRAMEEKLDRLLEKLHAQGEGALSAAEKRQLQDISARLRNRGRSSP